MKWQGWHLGFWLILKTNTGKQHDQTHGELLCTIWWHSTSILTLNFVEQNFHWWKVDSAQLAWIPVIRPLFSFQSSNMTGDSRLFPKCSKYIDLLMGCFFQHAEQWRWLQKLIQIIAVTTGWYYLAGAFAKHDSQSSSLFPKFLGAKIYQSVTAAQHPTLPVWSHVPLFSAYHQYFYDHPECTPPKTNMTMEKTWLTTTIWKMYLLSKMVAVNFPLPCLFTGGQLLKITMLRSFPQPPSQRGPPPHPGRPPRARRCESGHPQGAREGFLGRVSRERTADWKILLRCSSMKTCEKKTYPHLKLNSKSWKVTFSKKERIAFQLSFLKGRC